jgi:hypothetical protein
MAAVNEGKILVVADVAELAHKPAPARSPAGDHPISATLPFSGLPPLDRAHGCGLLRRPRQVFDS